MQLLKSVSRHTANNLLCYMVRSLSLGFDSVPNVAWPASSAQIVPASSADKGDRHHLTTWRPSGPAGQAAHHPHAALQPGGGCADPGHPRTGAAHSLTSKSKQHIK